MNAEFDVFVALNWNIPQTDTCRGPGLDCGRFSGVLWALLSY